MRSESNRRGAIWFAEHDQPLGSLSPDYSRPPWSGSKQLPEGLTGVAARQVEADAVRALPDPAADLDQAQAQRVQLEARHAHRGQPPPNRAEQPVGRRVQQQAELVG